VHQTAAEDHATAPGNDIFGILVVAERTADIKT
jgi:hypothetical protein